MATDLQRLARQARQWAELGAASGWLPNDGAECFSHFENHTPEALFEHSGSRPLVVAFFGGTGVGKSSLLNRLAGHPIARTGVERPTSREVSVFLHESVQLQRLPGEFPLEKVKIARHQEPAQRHILWIDMPDMDSTEQANRDLVLAWLPQIDVLVYVVSPERYRDGKAWRLLLEHGREHAWLFVMNQWDRAQAVQLEDFARQLTLAGFADPVILKTDSGEPASARQPDDFRRLAEIIQSLCNGHTVNQLEHRTRQVRLEQLAQNISHCLEHLQTGASAEQLKKRWDALWEQTEQSLLQGLQWPMLQFVQDFVAKGAPRADRVKTAGDAGKTPHAPANSPWDGWAQTLAEDAIDRIVLEASQAGLSHAELKTRADRLKVLLPHQVMAQAQQALRLSLANPGNTLQRHALRLTAVCCAVLPITALSWAGYQAITAFQASAASHANYLGADFAIHSGLLIAIAWLLPWFLHRQLAPSLEKAALKGLRHGLLSGLANTAGQVSELIDEGHRQKQEFFDAGYSLIKSCQTAEPAAQVIDEVLLSKLLQKTGPLGVAPDQAFSSTKPPAAGASSPE